MQQYGLIVADNGSNMYFQGTPDARWNDSDLHNLGNVDASAFDVVQMGPSTTQSLLHRAVPQSAVSPPRKPASRPAQQSL